MKNKYTSPEAKYIAIDLHQPLLQNSGDGEYEIGIDPITPGGGSGDIFPEND